MQEAEKFGNYDIAPLDATSAALIDSYALRYKVYCQETGFLPESKYPYQIEVDKYDDFSTHLGCYATSRDKSHKQLAGSVRLVSAEGQGFPLESHCALYPEYSDLLTPSPKTSEISRLCISSYFRRRKNDGLYGLDVETNQVYFRRNNRPVFLLALFKAMYQQSIRQGIETWLIAIEEGLRRMLAKNNIVFEPIGPEVDYYGPVRPYAAKVKSIEKHMTEKDPECMNFMKSGSQQEVPKGALWSYSSPSLLEAE